MSFYRTKKKTKSILDGEFSGVGISIKNPERLQQLRFIDLTTEDLRIIRCLKSFVEENIQQVVEEFYNNLESVPLLKQKITENTTSERLRKTLRKHIAEMFEGYLDDTYVEKRRRVAMVHVKIGLVQKWYLAAFQMLEKSIRNKINSLDLEEHGKHKACEAVSKICSFENQLVLEEYDAYASDLATETQNEVREQVKEVMGDISTKLDSQSLRTNDAVTDLIENTLQVNQYVKNSVSEAKLTKDASLEGYHQMQLLNHQTTQINEKTIEMSKMVQELDASSSEIHAVIEIVKNIAGQTNLLALNSAIEAARAGEHGKGFAVVADEVRKLADQTKSSVEQIASLIGMSSGVTTQVIQSIQEIQELVNTGIAQNKKSMLVFDNISDSVEQTITNFENVAKQITQLENVVNQISESSGELKMASTLLEQTIQSF